MIALKEPVPNDREGKQGLIIIHRLVLQCDNHGTLWNKVPIGLGAEARTTQIIHVFISFLFPWIKEEMVT